MQIRSLDENDVDTDEGGADGVSSPTQVVWQLEGKEHSELCSRVTITFYLHAPAWKQFLDLMLPLCLLNMFLVLMTVYPQDDSDYLSNAITLGLTLGFFFETRAASKKVTTG
jgi:hypothetical protein